MSRDYNSISDLLREVLEIKLIELTPHVLGLEQELVDALEDGSQGIYLPNTIEPVFHQNKKYIISKEDGKDQVYVTTKDLWDIIQGKMELPEGHIYNEKGNSIMSRSAFMRLKTYMSLGSLVQTKACEAAIAVVIEQLSELNPHTHVAERHYRLRSLVKPGFEELIENSRYQTAFDNLVLEVMRFVGRDTWNYYHIKVNGTTLVIEKGLDYRIYQWHLKEIKQRDGFDHDFGGVASGYGQTHTVN